MNDERETAVETMEIKAENDNTERLQAGWCDVANQTELIIEVQACLTVCPVAEQSVAGQSIAPVECATETCALRPDAQKPEPPESISDRLAEAWERQADARQAEREFRKRTVAFSHWAQDCGVAIETAADALDLSTRTLYRWRHDWNTDRLASRPRGRPCRCAAPEVRADVVAFLDDRGPGIGLPTLQHDYPQVTRAELVELLTAYRGDWRQAHIREQAELHWLRPGSVWAMDFSHPLQLIDGYFRSIFTVRDLASQQQLLWLPVEDEMTDTVIDCLHELFDEHGAPLVAKCDNGPAFVAQALKQFLRDWSVVTLYSPPYAPWYNGAIERSNRTLKEATEHIAERAGHPGYWTSPDLHAARLLVNRLRRPWGAEGPTPEEKWESRESLTMDERDVLFENLDAARRALCREREVDSDLPLAHRLESELTRLALQPVLESSGYLYVTRRRITPQLFRRNCDKIM